MCCIFVRSSAYEGLVCILLNEVGVGVGTHGFVGWGCVLSLAVFWVLGVGCLA